MQHQSVWTTFSKHKRSGEPINTKSNATIAFVSMMSTLAIIVTIETDGNFLTWTSGSRSVYSYIYMQNERRKYSFKKNKRNRNYIKWKVKSFQGQSTLAWVKSTNLLLIKMYQSLMSRRINATTEWSALPNKCQMNVLDWAITDVNWVTIRPILNYGCRNRKWKKCNLGAFTHRLRLSS